MAAKKHQTDVNVNVKKTQVIIVEKRPVMPSHLKIL